MPRLSAAKGPGASTHLEDELLRCCSRTRLDPERVYSIKALVRDHIDWKYLLRVAVRHGIMPLLYQHLNATCPEAVAKDALDLLRDLFHQNARHNLLLTSELCRILNLFEEYGIPAIPLKGPVLASSVYGNLALRQFCDLDILVHREHAPTAKGLLVTRGYQPQFLLNPVLEAMYLQTQSHYLLHRDDATILVELHWEIVPRYFSFTPDHDGMWKRRQLTNLGGATVLTLAPEDLLLVLCVHGAKHLWERLECICCVAELIGVPTGMAWERVMNQATTLGSRRMLFLGLFLAKDLLGASLPQEVAQQVESDRVVKSLAGQVRLRLFREPHGSSSLLESCLFHLKSRERWQDRIRYCLRLALTPTVGDWAFLALPDALFPLYYLVRPIRLAGRYGLGPLRRSYNEQNPQ